MESDQEVLATINFFQLIMKSFSAFDMRLEVCGMFLDISKAFGKVWHDGLIFKFRENGFCGEMTNISENFLATESEESF